MKKTIGHVGVVGAGTMGSAIAQHFCMKGLKVSVVDSNADGLVRGQKLLTDSLKDAVTAKVINQSEYDTALSQLTFSQSFSDLKSCEFIVEAVFEDLKVKQDLFRALEDIVSQDCILATNTSSLQVADIASGLKYPARCLGVHYFYHAAKNKLVEVIPGPKTDATYARQVYNFYEYIDKLPISCTDSPGFVVNRFFVPWLTEACRLYEEGFGSQAFIDDVCKKSFQVGMGPFALMNATGVPIALHAANGLAEKLGPFYAPAEILKRQVAKKLPWSLDSETISSGAKNNTEVVEKRMLAASLGVACQLVTENVCDPASVDLGARIGLRWPKGPFEMIREMGHSKAQALIADLFTHWKMKVPELNRSTSWINSFVHNDTGYIIFNNPDRMNALGEVVMKQFADAFNNLENNKQLKKIFILGRGKAFIAGADIKFFIDSIDNKQIQKIYEFTAFGQRTLLALQNSKIPTIAYLDGLTLGGGLELALACQYRVATARAYFAFPETGIGIYPGLGGTQRTARLIGKGLTKFLISTGQMINADTAKRYKLVHAVVPRVVDPLELSTLEFDKQFKEAAPDANLENAFANFRGTLDAADLSQELVKKSEVQLKRKAPIALKQAMKLVDDGYCKTLEDGLELELAGLNEIFSTKDAYIGLSSLITKTKPIFSGT